MNDEFDKRDLSVTFDPIEKALIIPNEFFALLQCVHNF